jgi:hypothetical protein
MHRHPAWRRAAEESTRIPPKAKRAARGASVRPVLLSAMALLCATLAIALAIALVFGAALGAWAPDPFGAIARLPSSTPADSIGWSAAALMVATFSCRDPLWMRPLAVCTNAAFIGYACFAALAPVLVLHALLLPINLLRWRQSLRASREGIRRVRRGFRTDAVY